MRLVGAAPMRSQQAGDGGFKSSWPSQGAELPEEEVQLYSEGFFHGAPE